MESEMVFAKSRKIIMNKKRKATEQNLRILREADTGLSVEDMGLKHGMRGCF